MTSHHTPREKRCLVILPSLKLFVPLLFFSPSLSPRSVSVSGVAVGVGVCVGCLRVHQIGCRLALLLLLLAGGRAGSRGD